jgi:3-isopropylmalate/(R)-2-methylmalate dehydratase small subunit
VPDAIVTRIWETIEADPDVEITVDMEQRIVEIPAIGLTEPFPIDDATQHRFLNGLDDIGITLTHADEIAGFEASRPSWLQASS